MQTRDSVSRADAYLGRWKLSNPQLVAETATSWVYRVERKKSGLAALKLLRPETSKDERFGGDMLDWYGGLGATHVYALSHDAILFEWVDGDPLSEMVRQGQDPTATEMICQVVSQLHTPRDMPPPRGITPLAQRFEDLFKADKAHWPLASRDMLIRTQIVARNLLASVRVEVPLHGDLHHDNILFSPRSWVAIDPKGLFGDPAYEFANCFMNPLDTIDICSSMARIEHMASTFSERLGYDRARILGFAAAQVALSACWDLLAHKPIKHQLAILPRLIAAQELAADPMRQG